jgi:hypothetical protein
MPAHRKNTKGRARLNNLRIGDIAKEALQEVKEVRAKKGVFQSLNQLSVEAAFLLRRTELGEDFSPGPKPTEVLA